MGVQESVQKSSERVHPLDDLTFQTMTGTGAHSHVINAE